MIGRHSQQTYHHPHQRQWIAPQDVSGQSFWLSRRQHQTLIHFLIQERFRDDGGSIDDRVDLDQRQIKYHYHRWTPFPARNRERKHALTRWQEAYQV